jgi:hypothetical protein
VKPIGILELPLEALGKERSMVDFPDPETPMMITTACAGGMASSVHMVAIGINSRLLVPR